MSDRLGPKEDTVRRITEWAAAEEAVRAALLTGSRADPNAPIDVLSDFDVLLFVSDDSDLAERADWLREFGSVLVTLTDRISYGDRDVPTLLVQYREGARIDFTLAPIEMLQRLADGSERSRELERGYRVLVDEELLAARLPPPSGLGYVPERPTEDEYVALVTEFWWESIYVAKNLMRGELLPAKYSGECVLRFECLMRMLEWYVQVERDWSQPVGSHGRGLHRLLTAEDRAALDATFADFQEAASWDALFALIRLFRGTARTVGRDLGYRYPDELDRDVEAYLREIHSQSGLSSDSSGSSGDRW